MTTATTTYRIPSARTTCPDNVMTAPEVLRMYALELQDLAQSIEDVEHHRRQVELHENGRIGHFGSTERTMQTERLELSKAERRIAEDIAAIKKTRSHAADAVLAKAERGAF